MTLKRELIFSAPAFIMIDLSLYLSTHATASAFPLYEESSFRFLGRFPDEELIPAKSTSSSGLPEIALVAADTASFTVSE
jgi:hypothetical protein